MKTLFTLYIFCFVLVLSVLSGCSDSAVTPITSAKGIEFFINGFSPAPSGEIYALWLAYPKPNKTNDRQTPQHGAIEYKLISTFDVNTTGAIIGFDTTNLLQKIGVDLSIIVHALVSVEKISAIGEEPYAPLMSGEITGTATSGNAALSVSNSEAIGYNFLNSAASASLASPEYAVDDYKGELYMMNALSASPTGVGLSNIPPLPAKWKYAMWVVDSSTKSLPPFNIFYGFITDAIQKDSNPNDNHFNYPGGRYPADTTQPVYDLTIDGRKTLMITLEPNFENGRPTTPFGTIILRSPIAQGLTRFTPFVLQNVASSLPSASIIIHR